MGLDMYALATDNALSAAVDFDAPDSVKIYNWRKHPNLHGWMERLYRKRGGRMRTFNCVNVALTADDLQQLEADIRTKCLPKTGGFFGVSDGSELEDDLAFIAKAREALAANRAVYYTSWW
ncbi:phosphoglycerate kinase [Bradyrhizobium cenepequi]|uniref:phosphoglycerate kinase n=1 Tax=Bradyrhizobium cenepequi TaxID=2821403 RepID=UPI001CE27FAF|nr:phosphoglycerate kinase [Bradyrhizobium cenepequi]MCA6111801.1 phosphoglycerate kinase [Bradyrhizobium cenepequi]